MIMAGNVLVNSQMVEKSGCLVSHDAEITLKVKPYPMSAERGLKLEKALESFQLSVQGMVVWMSALPRAVFRIVCFSTAPCVYMRWMSVTASWPGSSDRIAA